MKKEKGPMKNILECVIALREEGNVIKKMNNITSGQSETRGPSNVIQGTPTCEEFYNAIREAVSVIDRPTEGIFPRNILHVAHEFTQAPYINSWGGKKIIKQSDNQ